MNRITDIKHYKVVEEVETLLIHLEYPADEFDPLGNRKQMRRTLFPFLDGRFGTGSHVNYGYDKTSQLTAENYFRPATPNPLQFLSRTNTFDDSGNRLNLTENRGGIVKTIGGAFDEANGLEAETVSFDDVLNQQWQTVFERDLRGNTTKKTVPAGAGREKEEFNYEYNRRNNLTKVTRTKLGEQKEIGFQYNADGLRVEKSFVGGIGVSPVVKKYILDGVHAILERDGEDETKVRYIPGICTIHNPTSENPIPRYDLHDALGSVIAQVSLDEDEPPVVWAAQYGAYGKTLAQSSKTPSPYQWVGAHGYYADEDVGMYLMGLRWYDSFTGRFICRDPIGFAAGDSNFFRPMGNNPANAVDPWGLERRELTEKESTSLKSSIEKIKLVLPSLGETLASKLKNGEIKVDTDLTGYESGTVDKFFGSQIIYLAPDVIQYEDLLTNILVHEYVHTQQFRNVPNKVFWFLADGLRFLYDISTPGIIHRTLRGKWSPQAIFHDDKPSEMMAERLANSKFPKP